MPELKIERIVSFSSEDKVHAAKNLLGNNVSLKWKCCSPGEKNATVIFQLQKASVITGIDIGNENSAYIEVYVSRSGDVDADFKTFLVMSSFMSAIESRQSTNINRVRMFKTENFIKPECDEKWDRIKVVCTQPFNRHVQYGLSFIKFHTTASQEHESNKMIGKFSLRPESPIDLKGVLFSKRKENAENDKPLSAASSIREATYNLLNDTGDSPARGSKLLPSFLKNSASKKKNNDSLKLDESCFKARNRNELLYTEDEEKPHPKIDKLIDKKNMEKKNKNEEEKKETPKTKNRDKKESTPKAGTSKNGEHIKLKELNKTSDKKERQFVKRKLAADEDSSHKKNKHKKMTKPFNKLLEDVVLVISGIQNPDRGNLREKILEMGAKYRASWDSSCTHLVCAFMNTPKFNEVKGKGKIVTRKWVEECYAQRKKIPWRRYSLDKQEKDKPESEEEINEEEVLIPSSPLATEEPDDCDDTMELASDTEDRIEQIRNSNSSTSLNESKNSPAISKVEELDESTSNGAYSAETDTEDMTIPKDNKKSYDFFKGKAFFLDEFEEGVEDMLKNYIFIHEGILRERATENVDYIICGKERAGDLNTTNVKAICIMPDWIVDCHKCRQFIPPDEYFIFCIIYPRSYL